MTTTTMSYIFSPLSSLWSSLDQQLQMIGYSRAAAELARMGLMEESKKCMMEIKKLQQ